MRRRENISQPPTSGKRVPQRTCVVCRKVKAKRELMRLVCVSHNRVEVDTTGKKAGRGAYLCRAPECWRGGLKGNRLEHALRMSLTEENREQLIKYGEQLGENR